MDFFEVIKKRRSIRVFTEKKVDPQIINKALDTALLAPNSSNLQFWEFYWVRNAEKKKKLIEACFNQSAARTSQELIIAVSRLDTWNRNRKLLLEWAQKEYKGEPPKMLLDYYEKLIPLTFFRDPFYLKDFFVKVVTSTIGLFKPVPRSSFGNSRHFEVATKSTALACENLMLALVAQGLSCCPMEGYDEGRVKKILKLNRSSHIVMGIGIGYEDEKGLYSSQFRVPRNLVIKEV